MTGNAFILGISAGLLISNLAFAGPRVPEPILNQSSYTSMAQPATFDQYRNAITGQLQNQAISLEQEVTGFFENLSAAQIPLEYEFEKVLYDNLWDLYAS